jgi:hypothetical protein
LSQGVDQDHLAPTGANISIANRVLAVLSSWGEARQFTG